MNPEHILAASDTLGQLSNNLANMPEKQEADSIALQIESVRLFLVELSKYLIDGDDLHDAMLKAAKGELVITKATQQ